MNKRLLLAVLAVCLIPALFAIDKGLTGMVVNDTNLTSQPVVLAQDNLLGSAPIALFFTIAILVLIVAIIYTITLFKTERHIKKTSQNLNAVSKVKSHVSKASTVKLTDEQISKYIVVVVGAVGVVAAIIILIR